MDCMNLWLQLGLPIRVEYKGPSVARKVKGAFGKAAELETVKAATAKRVEENRMKKASEGAPQLCKDCGVEPRKASHTMRTYSYCRACDTERMRVYRARKKREQSEKT